MANCEIPQFFTEVDGGIRPSTSADYENPLPYLGGCQPNIMLYLSQRLTPLGENTNVLPPVHKHTQ
jgi:hypothetical protein